MRSESAFSSRENMYIALTGGHTNLRWNVHMFSLLFRHRHLPSQISLIHQHQISQIHQIQISHIHLIQKSHIQLRISNQVIQFHLHQFHLRHRIYLGRRNPSNLGLNLSQITNRHLYIVISLSQQNHTELKRENDVLHHQFNFLSKLVKMALGRMIW